MAPVRLRLLTASAVAFAAWLGFTPSARAQIAFAPNVGSFPNGVTLNVTPVVSHDRRYVRMTLNPIFNALEGFDAYSVPFAVAGGNRGGGGGGGGGAGGGFGGGGIGGGGGAGGVGGGGGAAGGGFRNMTVAAGMNGVVGPDDPFNQGMSPHAAYASNEASTILSGNAGYGESTGFNAVDANPGPSRRKSLKKIVRKAAPKKAAPAKPR